MSESLNSSSRDVTKVFIRTETVLTEAEIQTIINMIAGEILKYESGTQFKPFTIYDTKSRIPSVLAPTLNEGELEKIWKDFVRHQDIKEFYQKFYKELAPYYIKIDNEREALFICEKIDENGIVEGAICIFPSADTSAMECKFFNKERYKKIKNVNLGLELIELKNLGVDTEFVNSIEDVKFILQFIKQMNNFLGDHKGVVFVNELLKEYGKDVCNSINVFLCFNNKIKKYKQK